VGGYRTGHLHGELEIGVGKVADDAGGRSLEQHRHVATRRVLGLTEHEGARPGRRLPVDVAQRLTGVVRSYASELEAPQRHQASSSRFTQPARAGKQRTRSQLGEPRVDRDFERVADLAAGAHKTERVLCHRDQRRQTVDAPARRPRTRCRRPFRPRPKAGEVDGATVPVEVTGCARKRDLQSRHQGAIPHAQQDPQRLTGHRPVGRKRAHDRESPAGEHHQPQRHEEGGHERKRKQIELPGAQDTSRKVGGQGHQQQTDPSGCRARHRSIPGTGTVRSNPAITAASV
jgi:hypothetical protein